jgi:hypothetical protein
MSAGRRRVSLELVPNETQTDGTESALDRAHAECVRKEHVTETDENCLVAGYLIFNG